MVADVFNTGVNSGSLRHIEARTKLAKKVSITPMQRTKEEHHEKDRGKHYLAPRHIHDQTVEQKEKLHNWVRLSLDILEDGHEGHTSIHGGIRMTVLIKRRKHSKTLAMIQCPLVVAQEMEGTTSEVEPCPLLPFYCANLSC